MSGWIAACETIQTVLIPPCQTAESYFCCMLEVGRKNLETAFSLHSVFLKPLLCRIPLPKNSFSQATSVIISEPTQHPQSILLIVSPPRCLSFGSLYMDPTLSAWPWGEWHIWANYHGYSSAVSNSLFSPEGQTEANQWMTDHFAGF